MFECEAMQGNEKSGKLKSEEKEACFHTII